ncbi:ABC transporter substrate-binding protein [Cephaloticoccus primus]|uniref:ABC transporter substrate-binding protein n=1 Tax=Cephaloticoccus primus TaxID=1548207 RepID=A0A139SMM9_9BACT|nr:peptide ABC transporter substrate-binding protein [Cephaloticoccus primus]KXU35837.1 ABC transporter substrate-binding protein [Cephaloticoccus primus]
MPRETPVERGNRTQVLHRSLSADVAELDPHLVTGLPEIAVVTALFEGLVAEDPRDLSPVPGVAARWEISDDGLRYTFHLRPEARWSNGAALTAQDFLASYRRALSPALGADYASALYLVQKAQAYHRGLLDDFSQVGFVAPDPHTLVITLEHPAPQFLAELTQPVWFPVYLPAVEKTGAADARGNPWTRPENFVGNGPFTLKQWQPDRRIIVERNPYYWDSETVRLSAIHFHPSSSVEAEERAFRAGQVHLTEALPLSKIERYARQQPELLRVDPFFDTYFYRLNVTRPVLNEARIRRALSLAIDREAIVRLSGGRQRVAASFTPPGLAGYTPPQALRYDPQAARALLAEAGYPQGRGLPTLELLINNSDNHRTIAEAIQAMWQRELGIRITIVNMEQKTLLSQRRTLDYQMLRSDWAGDYLDPASFLEIFSSTSGNNHTGWSSQEYDSLLYRAARTADPAARYALLARAEEILLQELPIIPIYYAATVRLVHPSLHGWHPTLLDRHPYKHLWLEP